MRWHDHTITQEETHQGPGAHAPPLPRMLWNTETLTATRCFRHHVVETPGPCTVKTPYVQQHSHVPTVSDIMLGKIQSEEPESAHTPANSRYREAMRPSRAMRIPINRYTTPNRAHHGASGNRQARMTTCCVGMWWWYDMDG